MIRKTGLAESVDILGADLIRSPGQLQRIVDQMAGRSVDRGLGWIFEESIDSEGVVDLVTEVVCVGMHSVMASVGVAHDDGEGFSLSSGEGGWAVHDGLVEFEGGAEGFGCEALDLEDLEIALSLHRPS